MDTKAKLKRVLNATIELKRSLASLKYGLSKEEEPKQGIVRSFVKSESEHAEALEKRCIAILNVMYPEKTVEAIMDYWPDDL